MKRSEKSSYRWIALAIYAWIAGLSQLLWLNFASILSFVQNHYQVSESTASWLLLVFPLTYVLLSVHAGRLIDTRGYKYSIGLGAILMAVFSCLRIYTGNFWILLIAQTGISLGQPYIVNGMTKFVLDWFPPKNAALATGLGTVGLFVGMAVGLAATPPALEVFGFSGTMSLFAILTCVSCVGFLIFFKSRSHPRAKSSSTAIAAGFKSQLRNRNLILLFFISFIGLGFFNGLTSWIEAIVAPHGMSSAQAGIIGGILILGGILGSIIIPAISDSFGVRKPFLLLSIAAACLTLIPLCRGTQYQTLLIAGFLQGFFFLPSYALLLDMTSLEAGEKWAGSATGVLMLTGNAGGVLTIFGMGWVKDQEPDFHSAFTILLILLLLAGAASVLIRESRTNPSR